MSFSSRSRFRIMTLVFNRFLFFFDEQNFFFIINGLLETNVYEIVKFDSDV